MRFNRPESGVTLIDLIIALTIMAMVLTAVYSVFAFQQKAVRAAAENRDVYGQGLVILDRLCRDLSGTWLPESAVRDGSPIQYRFEGEVDSLNFASTSVLSVSEAQGDQIVEIGYRLVDNTDTAEDKYILYRRQDDSPDDDPENGGREFRMTSDLTSFEIIFRDQTNQETQSISAVQKDALPLAVQIKMELSTIEGQTEAFQTMVYLPVAQPLVTNVEVPSIFGGGD